MNFGLRISNCEFHEPNVQREVRADELRIEFLANREFLPAHNTPSHHEIRNSQFKIRNFLHEFHEPNARHEIRNSQFKIRNFLGYQQQLPCSFPSFQILVRLVRVL